MAMNPRGLSFIIHKCLIAPLQELLSTGRVEVANDSLVPCLTCGPPCVATHLRNNPCRTSNNKLHAVIKGLFKHLQDHRIVSLMKSSIYRQKCFPVTWRRDQSVHTQNICQNLLKSKEIVLPLRIHLRIQNQLNSKEIVLPLRIHQFIHLKSYNPNN